jgi:MFS family permease
VGRHRRTRWRSAACCCSAAASRDLFGRKRLFVVGLAGFADRLRDRRRRDQSIDMLLIARAAQGVFGALLAPAALAADHDLHRPQGARPRVRGVRRYRRDRGAAIGLLLGGVLTEYLDWRWALYVNLLFAIPAGIAAMALLDDTRHAAGKRVDIPGTLTASAGLFALVYGFSHAESASWSDPVTIGMLAGSVVLLAAFARLQTRVANPLLPMRVILDRDRGGSYLAVGIAGAGIFGAFLFLTYYLQQTLGFSPVKTGLAFLPMTATIMVTAMLTTARILPRTGPKPLVSSGMIFAAVAMVLLTGIGVDSSYAAHVLPSLLLLGVGFGLIMAPSMASATQGVRTEDAGVASAMVNTGQQVGGSVGTALLSTLATSAMTSFATTNGPGPEAAIHGYTTAFWWSAGIFAVGAIVTGLLLRGGVREIDPAAEPALAH